MCPGGEGGYMGYFSSLTAVQHFSVMYRTTGMLQQKTYRTQWRKYVQLNIQKDVNYYITILLCYKKMIQKVSKTCPTPTIHASFSEDRTKHYTI